MFKEESLVGCLGPRSACGKAEKFPELRPPRVDKGPCCVGKGCSRQRCPFAERRQGLPLIFDAVRFCIPLLARCPPVATSLHPFLQGTPEGSSASQILTLCRPMAAAGSGCRGFQGSLISLLECVGWLWAPSLGRWCPRGAFLASLDACSLDRVCKQIFPYFFGQDCIMSVESCLHRS